MIRMDPVKSTAHVILLLSAALVAGLVVPPASEGQVSREGQVGTITATIGGETSTFAVIGQVTGPNTQWGSGWTQNGPRVGMTIWGVSGSVAEADNQGDGLMIRVGYRMSERQSDMEAITRSCDPFTDAVTYTVNGSSSDMIGEECGGIQVESLEYDETAETFTVTGRFSGQLEDDGPAVTDGTFEATLSRR